MIFPEGGLQRREGLIIAEAFNRNDFFAVSLHGQHQAGANSRVIDDYRARTTNPVLTTEMGSRQTQPVSEAVCE